jgi:glucose-1-phosphate cytidylyltransferase
VTLVDTGDKTQTGGRLKRVRDYVGDEDFCFTYGDGLSDVNIADVIAMHRQKGTKATLTAVQPPGRFGVLGFDEQKIVSFEEKPQGDGSWINGGYFVLSPAVFDLLPGDDTIWEREPLGMLGASGELTAYLHRGFWQPMDTMRDKLLLEDLWATGRAPWRSW